MTSKSRTKQQQAAQQNTSPSKADGASKGDFPSLLELKRSIPSHLFTSDLKTSLGYAALDLASVTILFTAMVLLHRAGLWILFPAYWFLQGTIFWAIFVVAHDCGHGSFSSNQRLNDLVGLLLSTLILVPYTPWKLSHRHHHKNTGNIDKDEIFYPLRERDGEPPALITSGYFGMGLGWVLYLLVGYYPRHVSHINPFNPLFASALASAVLSVATWGAAVAATVYACTVLSFLSVFCFYLAPLFVFASWLVLTTFLHHNDEHVPWYGDSEWDYVKGNLSSVDRDYGWLHGVTHNIGTHQVHHLFPIIPHYHLVEATAAFRAAYPHLARVSNEPILSAFARVFRMYAHQMRIGNDVTIFEYRAVEQVSDSPRTQRVKATQASRVELHNVAA